MANHPLKALGIVAGAAIGVASAAYGAQKIVVNSISKTDVDFEFFASEQFYITTRDNARIVVYRDGPRNSGLPTLIFLHGYALCSPIWAHQFDLLRDKYDLVSIDIRGHGASSIGDNNFSLEVLADDLYDVIAQLEIDKYILVGHSTGGVVSMAFMEKYKHEADKKVAGLCLVSTLAHPPYHHIESFSEALTKFSLTGKAFHFVADIPLIGFPLARFALGKKASNAVCEFIRRCVISTDRNVCAELLKVLANFDFRRTLEVVISPAAVIVGTSDPVTPVKDARVVAKALGIQEVIIEDVGHCPMLESVDEFNQAFLDFLDKATPS